MGKRLIITVAFLFIISSVHAGKKDYNQQQIEIRDKKNHFTQWNIPADMPDVYYNYVSGTITIVDYVNATYYASDCPSGVYAVSLYQNGTMIDNHRAIKQ